MGSLPSRCKKPSNEGNEMEDETSLTMENVTKKIQELKELKASEEMHCAQLCYSIIINAYQKAGENAKQILENVLVHIYGKDNIIPLGCNTPNEHGETHIINIAMGDKGKPVHYIPESLRDALKIRKDFENKTKRGKKSRKKCSCICNRCQPVNFEGAILEMKCEPAISFRHISAVKTRLANEYALTREIDIKALNSCNTFIEKTNTTVLKDATFVVSCGDEVTVVFHAGNGSNVFEFALNEKGKPIKKEINHIVDRSYRRGACGAPHVRHTREFGYYVISETDIDKLVSDFKKWKLISEDDARLLLYVKRVFNKEGSEDVMAACPDIKSNVHLTVRCSKFNVVLKAGKCYNICTVYMEQSKPKYKCKRLSRWRRVVENISMYKFDKVLKDVRLGPFRLDLSDEITGGGADEAFVDEDNDSVNDDGHDDDFGDDGGDELS